MTVLRATGSDDLITRTPESVDHYAATVRVDASGRVRSMTVRHRGDGRVSNYEYRLLEAGVDDVRRPLWAGRALENGARRESVTTA